MITPGPQESWHSALAVVAHPDDEVIWCGGLILQHPDWDWTILCLCRANDAHRAVRFARVCELLQAEPVISDLDDSCPLKPIHPQWDIGGRILGHLHGGEWDVCLTHGANGEYGHQRHREIHRVVGDLVNERELSCEELWTFAYDCDAATGRCAPAPDADVLLPLSDRDLSEKRRIVHEVYGYGRGSFEVTACASPEAYHRHRVTVEGVSS